MQGIAADQSEPRKNLPLSTNHGARLILRRSEPGFRTNQVEIAARKRRKRRILVCACAARAARVIISRLSPPRRDNLRNSRLKEGKGRDGRFHGGRTDARRICGFRLSVGANPFLLLAFVYAKENPAIATRDSLRIYARMI